MFKEFTVAWEVHGRMGQELRLASYSRRPLHKAKWSPLASTHTCWEPGHKEQRNSVSRRPSDQTFPWPTVPDVKILAICGRHPSFPVAGSSGTPAKHMI